MNQKNIQVKFYLNYYILKIIKNLLVVDIKLKEDLEFLNEKFKEMKYEIEGTYK